MVLCAGLRGLHFWAAHLGGHRGQCKELGRGTCQGLSAEEGTDPTQPPGGALGCGEAGQSFSGSDVP